LTNPDKKTLKLKLPRLYDKQREAIFCDERYGVIEASTKTGKTVGCMAWLMSEAWTKGRDGRNYWWIAPTFQVSKIAYSRIKRMLSRTDPKRKIWIKNESELWIEFINGGRLWFKGADKPDSLFGEDVFAAVIDEATRCKEDAWHAVRSTLTATKGPIRIIGNVKGRKNWAYSIARRAESGDEAMHYSKLTAYDAVQAGVLDMDEVKDAERTLPEHVFRELDLAEPSDDGGNPFGLRPIKACVLGDTPTGDPVVYGVDLAKSVDWTWVIGLDGAGNEVVSERWQAPWGETRERIMRIVGETPTLIDSTGVGDPIVEDLQRERPTIEGFKFTSTSKQQIMEGLASAIQTNQVGLRDEMLISELEEFEYQYTRTGVRYTAPEGQHDDGVCALALAVHHRHKAATSRLDVSLLGAGAAIEEYDAINDDRMWQTI